MFSGKTWKQARLWGQRQRERFSPSVLGPEAVSLDTQTRKMGSCDRAWKGGKRKKKNRKEPPVRHKKMQLPKEWDRDCPGGPVAKTSRSQCRRLGFDPWSGN